MQMFKSIKDQTDEVLLVKLKRGNIRSFEAIYDRYAPMVLNFVRKMIKDQMRAEDITQNIFMRLYVSRNSLEPGLSLKNWLFVCARNEALDVLRSKWAKDLAKVQEIMEDAQASVPEDEYEVIKVEYHDDATATVAQIPDFVVRWEYENRSSVTQQLSTGFSSTATRTSSFSNTYGVSVSVTSSFSVNVPVASANLTISMNSSYSHTWGKSETQSDTRNYNFPISVPPYCRIVAEAIVARYQLNVGYTTYSRSVNTGKEIRLEGRWSGIDCAEIKAKCTEYELDSNNITKIKTFNGVPHEAVVS